MIDITCPEDLWKDIAAEVPILASPCGGLQHDLQSFEFSGFPEEAPDAVQEHINAVMNRSAQRRRREQGGPQDRTGREPEEAESDELLERAGAALRAAAERRRDAVKEKAPAHNVDGLTERIRMAAADAWKRRQASSEAVSDAPSTTASSSDLSPHSDGSLSHGGGKNAEWPLASPGLGQQASWVNAAPWADVAQPGMAPQQMMQQMHSTPQMQPMQLMQPLQPLQPMQPAQHIQHMQHMQPTQQMQMQQMQQPMQLQPLQMQPVQQMQMDHMQPQVLIFQGSQGLQHVIPQPGMQGMSSNVMPQLMVAHQVMVPVQGMMQNGLAAQPVPEGMPVMQGIGQMPQGGMFPHMQMQALVPCPQILGQSLLEGQMPPVPRQPFSAVPLPPSAQPQLIPTGIMQAQRVQQGYGCGHGATGANWSPGFVLPERAQLTSAVLSHREPLVCPQCQVHHANHMNVPLSYAGC